VGGQHQAPAALPPGKTRYPLYRRLGGPQGRSGQVRKISPPPGFFLTLRFVLILCFIMVLDFHCSSFCIVLPCSWIVRAAWSELPSFATRGRRLLARHTAHPASEGRELMKFGQQCRNFFSKRAGFFYMPQSRDMGQILLLPLRRKACCGFLPAGKIRRLRSGRIRSPDRPARSQSLYRLSYRALIRPTHVL
jgi:hypothetical protein